MRGRELATREIIFTLLGVQFYDHIPCISYPKLANLRVTISYIYIDIPSFLLTFVNGYVAHLVDIEKCHAMLLTERNGLILHGKKSLVHQVKLPV